MGDPSIVARAFRYPGPGHLDALATAAATVTDDTVRRELGLFVDRVRTLTLAEWEELHTETLDLSPRFVPYVGHVVWGENYRRGAFMADLSRSMTEHGVATNGELPDHIEPILRYIDTVEAPLIDLIEVLPQAVGGMVKELRAADKANPYLHVLAAAAAAVHHVVESSRKVTP